MLKRCSKTHESLVGLGWEYVGSDMQWCNTTKCKEWIHFYRKRPDPALKLSKSAERRRQQHVYTTSGALRVEGILPNSRYE